jgi:autotransporter translocation and assembly factor TamB
MLRWGGDGDKFKYLLNLNSLWVTDVGIAKLSGSEAVLQANVTVQDFWTWAYSDILSNRNRSVFAEFLVAVALDLTHQPRIEWDAVDLRYRNNKIEVKASAYLQSWQQSKPSVIRFDIAKNKG